jgi:hypothetical protein
VSWPRSKQTLLVNACYHARYGQCTCQPGDPPIGDPKYAAKRRHVDAGDLDALRQLTAWLQAGERHCHIRYADGEFLSILGRDGVNTDGQPHQVAGLPLKLASTLNDIAESDEPNLLIGGDWRRPAEAWPWLVDRGLEQRLPWCPSQVFVNGILSGDLVAWLDAVWEHPDRTFLVANQAVCDAVAPGLRAIPVPIVARGAYPESISQACGYLKGEMRDHDLAIYACGLGGKPMIWDLFESRPETSHIDVGCVFDLATGHRSRSWCLDDTDERVIEYRKSIMPWLSL